MLPVVVIVGRPNVGKSTLFNRLTHTRNAVVSAFPGTTRDRQYGEAKIDGNHFILIDTGGITDDEIGDTPDEINQQIKAQALQAIQEADIVLFMIDGKAGVTREDTRLALMLRKMHKPIQLVVNKSEGKNPDLALADAYELGFPNPIPIAAAHGSGVSELIQTIFPTISKTASEEASLPEKAVKLAIVGRPNVGKSTLTNRILGEERVIVHDAPGTTRDSIFIPLERFEKQYILIDTAGVRKRSKVREADAPEKFSVVKTLQAIESANVVLYVLDARMGVSDQDMKLLGFILECGKALVIAVNKWDGMSESAREEARLSVDKYLDFVKFARIHFISALHGSGVGNLFASIDEAYASAIKKLPTPELTRILQKALLAHSPPLVQGRRVKLRYAHAGGHNPPRIIIHGNQVLALPESYRKFLAHYFQSRLNLHGTPVVVEFKTNENPYADKS